MPDDDDMAYIQQARRQTKRMLTAYCILCPLLPAFMIWQGGWASVGAAIGSLTGWFVALSARIFVIPFIERTRVE